MGKLKDVAVVVGTYMKDGKSTFKWKTVGALIENASGKQYIMLDKSFNPSGCYVEQGKEGSDQIVMSLFEPKQWSGGVGVSDASSQTQSKKKPAQQTHDDWEDSDVGF